MTIYIFALASMFKFTGADTAICHRASVLEKAGYNVKMIITEPPCIRDLDLFSGKGVNIDSIICTHLFFTDFVSLKPSKKVGDAVAELKQRIGFTEAEYEKTGVILKKDGCMVASIQLTGDGEHFYSIRYFRNICLIREDYYSDHRYASWFYETTVDAEGKQHAALHSRVFYNRDGSIALIQMKNGEKQLNILKNGEVYNKERFFALFIEKLKLTKDDLVFIDRPTFLFPMKPLLACYKNTNLIAVMHSEHYLEKGRSNIGYKLNREYWYWFKYSHYIHSIIVGTDLQKKNLKNCLEDYHRVVPDIQVMPPFGLDKLRYPEKERRKKSILCVSRLDNRKKIDWTIYTAVKAHEIDAEISLDIYGEGTQQYLNYLNEIIRKTHASEYITLKGFRDVTEEYKNYEVFLTTSLWETFGIALLEAMGSGLPIVGFDVDYGNTQFIRDGENGYKIPYNREHYNLECPEEVDYLAEKVVKLLADDNKKAEFSKKSYEMAAEYLPEKIKERWMNYLHGFAGKNELQKLLMKLRKF